MRCKACNKLLPAKWPLERELCPVCFGQSQRASDATHAELIGRARRCAEGRTEPGVDPLRGARGHTDWHDS